MKPHPTIAIIGSGVSGLTMMKALRDRGISYTTFEKSDQIGGNWVFRNKNGMSSAYRSLHIDSSRYSIEFDDFPFPPGLSRLSAPHANRGLLSGLCRPL